MCIRDRYDDEEYEDDYDDQYDEHYEDDYNDRYDEDDYDTRSVKSRQNRGDDGPKPKMSGVMKMVIILIAVLVVCAAGYGIGNAVGLFGGDSKKTCPLYTSRCV